jgi:hypothetical protein
VSYIQWPFGSKFSGYQVATHMNDCLYRFRHESDFMIQSDVDEYFVPYYGQVCLMRGGYA